jgi:hypothetical protein
MLHSLLPKAHHKFLSLPLLGPIADDFDDWLAVNGYTRVSRKNAIHMLRRVDAASSDCAGQTGSTPVAHTMEQRPHDPPLAGVTLR